MNYAEKIAAELELKAGQVSRTIGLMDEGNTLPFIARYRKEVTGELDEEQIRQISELAGKLRALDERRETVLAAIEEQGKLTPELKQKIDAAETLTALEDLYQPYKKKRKTRADKAREQGLEPLAELILKQGRVRDSLNAIAQPYLSEEVPDADAAWAGARDIVAEQIADQAEIRGEVREKALRFGSIQAQKVKNAEDVKGVYKLYYEFDQQVRRIRPHQVLALNRGEAEKVLRVKVVVPQRDWLKAIASRFLPRRNSTFFKQLDEAIHDAAGRLLLPAIERDVRRALTATAETHAIQVFADNLRALLGQPPLAGQTIMGIDPAYRTGCKIAVIDQMGKVIDTTAIYPHPPQNKKKEALQTLTELTDKHGVTLLTIGNGTASRETEQLAAEFIRQREKEKGNAPKYLIVNEAGASVYSASPLARQELPDLDVSIRGAVSIARRVQDPLAELVKIDPKAIGVGLYQHDVNQRQLAETLDGVVESVVNQVGVDVNSASPALLTHVSGIGPKLAERIVDYRDENGRFPDRATLKEVSGLGPKSFEQAAGFLRVRDGRNWLDSSAIHPESYGIARKVMRKAGVSGDESLEAREKALSQLSVSQMAKELNAGEPTLRDIFQQLIRPGRDPREDAPAPVLRSDVLSMEDLEKGMILKGTVRNVVDFGAFIDIGVKQDGLLHRSKMPQGVSLSVGDVLQVQILKVEIERGRIGLGWVA